jgi:hypothetical protein
MSWETYREYEQELTVRLSDGTGPSSPKSTATKLSKVRINAADTTNKQ